MKQFDLTFETVGNVLDLPEDARYAGGLSLAIGFFDGVHLGHAEVIRRAVAAARTSGQTAAVMTFDPHPRAVLGQDEQYDNVLTPLADKLALCAELGVEAAYIIRFDHDFASVTAERFVRELLLPLDVRTAVVGFDFSFGNKGRGNAELLRQEGTGAIDVLVADPVVFEGEKISSTRVREQLAAGQCAAASRMLGRSYVVKGTVVHGDARGRQLGYPTANVLPQDPYVIPKVGVYAVTVNILDGHDQKAEPYHAVLNIGYRPTFDAPNGELKLEAHLFDFDGDLYGKTLEITFREFIRAERKFPSLEQLILQIGEDAASARAILEALRV